MREVLRYASEMHKYRERQKAEAKKRRRAIVRLRDQKRTLEDVGRLYGITPQRVWQLECRGRDEQEEIK